MAESLTPTADLYWTPHKYRPDVAEYAAQASLSVQLLIREYLRYFAVTHVTAYILDLLVEGLTPTAEDHAKQHACEQLASLRTEAGILEATDVILFLQRASGITSKQLLDQSEHMSHRLKTKQLLQKEEAYAEFTGEIPPSRLGDMTPTVSLSRKLQAELDTKDAMIAAYERRLNALDVQHRGERPDFNWSETMREKPLGTILSMEAAARDAGAAEPGTKPGKGKGKSLIVSARKVEGRGGAEAGGAVTLVARTPPRGVVVDAARALAEEQRHAFSPRRIVAKLHEQQEAQFQANLAAAVEREKDRDPMRGVNIHYPSGIHTSAQHLPYSPLLLDAARVQSESEEFRHHLRAIAAAESAKREEMTMSAVPRPSFDVGSDAPPVVSNPAAATAYAKMTTDTLPLTYTASVAAGPSIAARTQAAVKDRAAGLLLPTQRPPRTTPTDAMAGHIVNPIKTDHINAVAVQNYELVVPPLTDAASFPPLTKQDEFRAFCSGVIETEKRMLPPPSDAKTDTLPPAAEPITLLECARLLSDKKPLQLQYEARESLYKPVSDTAAQIVARVPRPLHGPENYKSRQSGVYHALDLERRTTELNWPAYNIAA